MNNIKKEKGEKNTPSISQKVIVWLKRTFTATVVGVALSAIGVMLTIVFWLLPSPDAKKPFSTTVKVYGWEGYEHNPLNGKGAITLALNKPETVGMNARGIAVFTDIPPEYNGKTVAIHITDTENVPYYLADSVIKIQKNGTTNIQVLLRGLDKLEGTVIGNDSGEGLPDVSVTIAGINATTDETGNFCIDIPIEKQRTEQEIEITKKGYKSKRQTIPMTGEHKYRTVLEQQ